MSEVWTFDPLDCTSEEVARYLALSERQHPTAHYFKFEHLKARAPVAALVSEQYARLAAVTISACDQDPRECAVALRKLLEAKDAAVRAALVR